jgi:hypothetical protein
VGRGRGRGPVLGSCEVEKSGKKKRRREEHTLKLACNPFKAKSSP